MLPRLDLYVWLKLSLQAKPSIKSVGKNKHTNNIWLWLVSHDILHRGKRDSWISGEHHLLKVFKKDHIYDVFSALLKRKGNSV